MSVFTPPTLEELQENFQQYKVESFIAQGGMGAVYLARQISLDRPVAIKILPQEFGDDTDYRASFEMEAQAMAKLNHVNLVGIYDFGEINGMLFIVMEYVPGRSLFDTAHGQQVDEKEAAKLIAHMCDGLEHAHQAGILHRDIKPANVLIDDEAKPKIVDFGLAKAISHGQAEGVIFGTPDYTAPEVIQNPHSVDHRSDIFSMGVMLYELLTGQLPGKPVFPASSISKSDPRFDSILAKAIHVNPNFRYSSAIELSDDLNDLLSNFDKPVSNQLTNPLLTSALTQRKNIPPRTVTYVNTNSGSGMVKPVVILLIVACISYVAYSLIGKKDDTATIKKSKVAKANTSSKPNEEDPIDELSAVGLIDFIRATKENTKSQLRKINEKSQKEKDAIYTKLEYDLGLEAKKIRKKFLPNTLNNIHIHIENLRANDSMEQLPEKFTDDMQNVAIPYIERCEIQFEKARYISKKEKLRDSYSKKLIDYKANRLRATNEYANSMVDKEIESVSDFNDFIELFEE